MHRGAEATIIVIAIATVVFIAIFVVLVSDGKWGWAVKTSVRLRVQSYRGGLHDAD
jgi:hypothetical protein